MRNSVIPRGQLWTSQNVLRPFLNSTQQVMASTSKSSPWVQIFEPHPEAYIQLVCFPGAGEQGTYMHCSIQI